MARSQLLSLILARPHQKVADPWPKKYISNIFARIDFDRINNFLRSVEKKLFFLL